ncbi:MAG TPA: DUF1876 domain-containing protein [Mycobacteriales bacterium]|nr:DUF1876 domain-containing protein [Mycobacteriales bacterium]
MHTTRWTVSISLFEEGDLTKAAAVLHTDDTERLHGHGSARRNPRDPAVPEVGDELAAARALSDLAHQLLHAAITDIETITAKPAQLRA